MSKILEVRRDPEGDGEAMNKQTLVCYVSRNRAQGKKRWVVTKS